MDSGGRIYGPEEVAAMARAERVLRGMEPIPAKALATVKAMTIPERVAWHAKRKAARLAAKRARKARRAQR